MGVKSLKSNLIEMKVADQTKIVKNALKCPLMNFCSPIQEIPVEVILEIAGD